MEGDDEAGDDEGNDADDERMTEDGKFAFCSNNRGGNLPKRVKNGYEFSGRYSAVKTRKRI
jgi:hypothetical protein